MSNTAQFCAVKKLNFLKMSKGVGKTPTYINLTEGISFISENELNSIPDTLANSPANNIIWSIAPHANSRRSEVVPTSSKLALSRRIPAANDRPEDLSGLLSLAGNDLLSCEFHTDYHLPDVWIGPKCSRSFTLQSGVYVFFLLLVKLVTATVKTTHKLNTFPLSYKEI